MKTLVLLHGWGMTPDVFDALAAELSLRYSVMRPALPGYACSRPPSPYTLEHLAAEISAIAPARCCVAGWSLGAHIALEWARVRPEQVERLAVIAGTPCFVRRPDWPSAMDERLLQSFSDALPEDPERTLARFAVLQAQGDSVSKIVAQKLRHALIRNPSSHLQALLAGLAILRESDIRDALPRVSQRTLVVHGENDGLIPIAAARHVAAALPNARLVTIGAAGHAPFVSNPERIARLLSGHLDER